MSNSNHDPKNKECLLNHLDPICFPSGNVRPVLHIEHDMNGKKFVCPYSVCTCRPEQKEECSEFHREGFGDSIHKFCNDIAFQLHPSNDTMEAVRLIRQELPNLLSTQIALAEERGRDAQQKEDYEIAKAQQEKAFKSGTEIGEERGRREEVILFMESIQKKAETVQPNLLLNEVVNYAYDRIKTLTQKS